MRATSKVSFEEASSGWEAVLSRSVGRTSTFGEQLYATADLLNGSVALSRALTDPARSGKDKAALVRELLEGKVADEVCELVQGMARARWSAPADLAHGLEILAVDSLLAAAEAGGRLSDVEDELFRIDRLLTRERDLRRALSNSDLPVDRRLGLVESLFEGRVSPETSLFVERATTTLRSRSVLSALHAIGERAAHRRDRLVATVIAAAPLTSKQIDRLADILRRAYGRSIQVNVGVDPLVIGGLRITVGSEVVDATVLGRLAQVRTRIAG